MKRDIKLFLEDIVESIARIEEYTEDINEESFIQEHWVQDAVMRRLEVIGEAVKSVPDDIKKEYPNIP